MSDPITFATEAERLKAREQFVTLVAEVWPLLVSGGAAQRGRDFDRRFPPITPPKMVPWEGWVYVTPDGRNIGGAGPILRPDCAPAGCRIARVRVEEVEEGT